MIIKKAIKNRFIYLLIIVIIISNIIIKVKADEHHIKQFKIIDFGVKRVWCHYEGPKEVYAYIFNPNLTQIGYLALTELGENAWYINFDFNSTGEFLFQFYYGLPYTYIGSTIFLVKEQIVNGEKPDVAQNYTGGSWPWPQPKTIFSVSTEIFNAPTDPIQFISNRYQPEIKLRIVPLDSMGLLINPNMREIVVIVQVEGGNEKKTIERKIYLYEESIELTFSPVLKLSRGLLAFNNVDYLLKITTSDLEGTTSYNEYIISSPRDFAIMRSLLVVILIVLIFYLAFKSE